MLNIVGKRYWYFLFSTLVIVPGIISLLLPGGVRLGVDFTGGTLWELQFSRPVQPAEVRAIFDKDGLDPVVQTTGTDSVLIRSKEIGADTPEKPKLESELRALFGDFTELRFESVGPTVGSEISSRSVLAVGLASIGILIYIWYAFRRVPGSFRYGVCAIAALLHDVFVVVGVFSILGRITGIEMDTLFVTALLTIIGFSVHDTIVVFDRIRENMVRHSGEPFETVVNHSILQTLGRSVSTSLTVVFTLTALVLFGGATTRTFALVLLVGIASGTYSSIFNASPLLVVWEYGEIGKLLGRRRQERLGAAS